MTHAFGFFARFLVLFLVVLGLAACGSGAVSGPPAAVAPLSVTPSTATLFSELPTSFTLTGGTAPYFVTSSNQAIVPVIGTVSGTTFAVVPNPVAADTPVTLTVSDSVGTTPATAALTVRPRTISNVVTVTPSSAACGTSICPGGDAEVRVVLMQNGVPLSRRQVRFEVTSGQALVLTGSPEVASSSGVTQTDATGTGRIRIRIPSDATEQTALLRITDVTSGSQVLTSVAVSIASAPLNARPTQISFVGRTPTTCATSEISATVIVFGGRPPYSISQPASFVIEPGNRIVTSSGGSFTVRATGVCASSETISIVDSNGSTVNVTVANGVGTGPAPPAFSATPSVVTLDSCDSRATVTLIGGSGGYQFNELSGSVTVTQMNANQFTLQRRSASGAALSPTRVGFTDGRTVTEVTVNLGPVAQGPC